MSEWILVESNKTKVIYNTRPHCNNEVTFLPIDECAKDLMLDFGECTNHDYEAKFIGLRKCSHPDCGQIIFFSFHNTANPVGYDHFGEIEYSDNMINLEIFPEVDKCSYLENLPKNVEDSFIEAQKCFYSRYFMASAVMIRKTLEEICADKGFKEGFIKPKIDKLLSSGKLPSEIGKELHELREFGNDGAHVELLNFNNIGKKEVESALNLLSLILEQIYEPKPDKYKLAIENLKAHKK